MTTVSLMTSSIQDLLEKADACIYSRMVINKAQNLGIWWKVTGTILLLAISRHYLKAHSSGRGLRVPTTTGVCSWWQCSSRPTPAPHLGHEQAVVGGTRNCPWKLSGVDVNAPSFLEFDTKTLQQTIPVFCKQYTKLSNIFYSIFCSNSIS